MAPDQYREVVSDCSGERDRQKMCNSANINAKTAATPKPTTIMGMMVSERLFGAQDRRIGMIASIAEARRQSSNEMFIFFE